MKPVTVDIELKNGSVIPCHTYGKGQKVLIVLPGFGYGPVQVEPLVKRMLPHYRVIFPEHPFQAGRWIGDHFEPGDIAELIGSVFNKNTTADFHLLGHSLGARVWLKILPLLHFSPRSLTLVAPDGIGGRYTGWIDRLPTFAISTISSLLEQPRGILRLADFLRRRRLINAFSYRYLQVQLRNPFERQRLIGTLLSIPHFEIGKAEFEFAGRLDRVNILMGENDGLLRHDKIEAAFKAYPNVSVKKIKGGHGMPLNEIERLLLP